MNEYLIIYFITRCDAKKDKNLRAIPFKTSELVAELLDKKLQELKGKAD